MPEQTTSAPYAVHCRHDGHRLFIELHGEIDILAAPPGSDFLDDIGDISDIGDIDDGPGADTDAVVDLRGVTFIDGSGLNALLRLAERLRVSGHIVAVVVTDPFHRRLLRLVGLGPNVTMHSAVPAAVPSRSSPPCADSRCSRGQGPRPRVHADW